MIEIRPIWKLEQSDQVSPQNAIANILSLEREIVQISESCFNFLDEILEKDAVNDIRFLQKSSKHDLVAGCELARSGYLKQAYSLWRSWFEQSIFLIYFLEAPLHRSAWKVASQVNQDDSPAHRLMLHQLLNESSEKHPFTLVYDARFASLTTALNISGIPKTKKPIYRANRILTMLSQGVHGTYQPQPAKDIDSLCDQLDKHCIQILKDSSAVLNIFWVLLITNLIAFPQEILVKLRQGKISDLDINNASLPAAIQIAALAPLFAEAFP